MRTIFVLFDSLNRHMLGAYGGDFVATPNFDRFAERAVAFDSHYVGSLPCIPARRDLHTGRLNFMHRSWGPLEPFDNSFSRMLSERGIYTHIVSDHLHYFSDGGNGYTTAFDTWDFIRGQCYDPVEVMVRPPLKRLREMFDDRNYPSEGLVDGSNVTRMGSDYIEWKRCQTMVNRLFIKEEKDFPTAKCFEAAFRFLETNKDADDWFLQLECFDPHEPFHAPDRFKQAVQPGYEGRILDWPRYEKQRHDVEYTPAEIAEIRGNYAALVAMCDEYFGKLLDWMNENRLWESTCVMLTTDHGFLLNEHDWWGKNRMPYYEEISRIPLMIWHPDFRSLKASRRQSLTQAIDVMPTILEFSGLQAPAEATGRSLVQVLERDSAVREEAILGMFTGPLCVVDGRHTYFRYPVKGEARWSMYTLSPAHLAKMFEPHELRSASLAPPFDFTKGAPLLKVPLDPRNGQVGSDNKSLGDARTALYDLAEDPRQENPLDDPVNERRLAEAAVRELLRHDAPIEYYELFDLTRPEPDGRRAPRSAHDAPAAM